MSNRTRRQFFNAFGGAAFLAGFHNISWPAKSLHEALKSARPPTSPLFEEVPPSASKITFRHVNGRSPDYYLPETTGAGCAFFDFDNDGWMDIYLVNSGKCDFFDPSPPLRNALYRNNRDGTFNDVTEQAGVATGGYGMGVAVA